MNMPAEDNQEEDSEEEYTPVQPLQVVIVDVRYGSRLTGPWPPHSPG